MSGGRGREEGRERGMDQWTEGCGLVDPLLGLKPLGRLNYDKLDLI